MIFGMKRLHKITLVVILSFSLVGCGGAIAKVSVDLLQPLFKSIGEVIEGAGRNIDEALASFKELLSMGGRQLSDQEQELLAQLMPRIAARSANSLHKKRMKPFVLYPYMASYKNSKESEIVSKLKHIIEVDQSCQWKERAIADTYILSNEKLSLIRIDTQFTEVVPGVHDLYEEELQVFNEKEEGGFDLIANKQEYETYSMHKLEKGVIFDVIEPKPERSIIDEQALDVATNFEAMKLLLDAIKKGKETYSYNYAAFDDGNPVFYRNDVKIEPVFYQNRLDMVFNVEEKEYLVGDTQQVLATKANSLINSNGIVLKVLIEMPNAITLEYVLQDVTRYSIPSKCRKNIDNDPFDDVEWIQKGGSGKGEGKVTPFNELDWIKK
mgnify:CR=1 FL=1|jgi:hypothetical protein